MLTNPSIRAVVPPWGGELAVEILPHLDWPALRAADPTWLVGYSDLSTLLLPLTMRTATATLYGQNLMDTPYQVPAPLVSWLDVANRPAGATISQGSSTYHRASGFDSWQDDPTTSEHTLDAASTWRLLDPGAGEVHVSGRLLGGCIEAVSILAGTPTATCRRSSASMPPRRLLVYLEASGDVATDIARDLGRPRPARGSQGP